MEKRGFELEDSNTKSNPIKLTNHLLVIAINTYSFLSNLRNCVTDAEAFIDVLTTLYQFEEENITRIFEQEASRTNILDTLDSLSAQLGEEDNLIIYFAGHGYYKSSSRTGFLVPTDGRISSVSSLIYNAQIREYIQGLSVHHLVLFVDSCFSGELILRGSDQVDMEKTAHFAQQVYAFPSRWGLAAGNIELVSDGPIGDSSPFAKSLITYLKKYQGEKFPISDLIQHVKKITTYNSAQIPVGGVLKNTDDQGGEFVFHKKTVPSLVSIAKDKKETQTPRQGTPIISSQPNHMPSKDIIIDKLINQEIIEALNLLSPLLPDREQNTIILLKSRYNSLQNDLIKGVVSEENSNIRLNRIIDAVNNLLGKLR